MPLDQSIINLTKAIRQIETGNRPVSGGSGEFGRYQFMPGTWQSWAGKWLGNPNAEHSLENENKVAYYQIKSWKNQGYNPGQIASLWNSGSPQWQGKVGVNSAGVPYNVPNYVNKVYAEYKKQSQLNPVQKTQTQPIEQKPTTPIGSIAGLATGAGKGIIEQLKGASSLGERFLRGTLKTLLPKAVEKSLGIETPSAQIQTGAEQLIPESLTKATTTMEKIGKGVSEIAPYFIPGGASLKLGKVAEAAVKAPKLAKLASLGARAATEAGIFGGISAAQQGKIDDQTLKNALIGGAFPIAGAGLKVIGKPFVKGKANLAERFVNSLIKPLSKDLSYGKNPARGILNEGITFNNFEEGITKAEQAIKNNVSKLENQLTQAKYQNVSFNLTDSLKPIDDAIANAAKGGKPNQAIISRLQDYKDAILNNYQVVNGELIPVKARNLSYLSPKETIQLKRDIGEMTKFTGAISDDNIVNGALKRVYGSIKAKMEQKIPEIMPLNERLADLISAKSVLVNRDKIAQRLNIIGLAPKISAYGFGGLGIVTMNPAALAAAFLSVTMDKLFASASFKTKFAKWLYSASREEIDILYKQAPAVRPILDRIFGAKEKKPSLPKIKLELDKTLLLPAPRFIAGQEFKGYDAGALPQPNIPYAEQIKKLKTKAK